MRIIILFFVAILFSCTQKTTKDKPVVATIVNVEPLEDSAPPVIDMHNAQNALDWDATYIGTLPCPDCEGIKTEITLGRPQTYSISKSFEGKTRIEHATNNGYFIWVDGSTIKMEDADHNPIYYFIGEEWIKQLDKEGKLITGALAEKYKLMKQ